MVKLKLTLNSHKPSVVYSTNGKHYLLNPGTNTLNLSYEDYVALAKALSIKPIKANDDLDNSLISKSSNLNTAEKNTNVEEYKEEYKEESTVEEYKEETSNEETTNEESTNVEESTNEETSNDQDGSTVEETSNVEESNEESTTVEEYTNEESTNEESTVEEVKTNVEDECTNDIDECTNYENDYSSMSYNELRAMYKNITGESCKMKKAEIIAFLQEHQNAE